MNRTIYFCNVCGNQIDPKDMVEQDFQFEGIKNIYIEKLNNFQIFGHKHFHQECAYSLMKEISKQINKSIDFNSKVEAKIIVGAKSDE